MSRDPAPVNRPDPTCHRSLTGSGWRIRGTARSQDPVRCFNGGKDGMSEPERSSPGSILSPGKTSADAAEAASAPPHTDEPLTRFGSGEHLSWIGGDEGAKEPGTAPCAGPRCHIAGRGSQPSPAGPDAIPCEWAPWPSHEVDLRQPGGSDRRADAPSVRPTQSSIARASHGRVGLAEAPGPPESADASQADAFSYPSSVLGKSSSGGLSPPAPVHRRGTLSCSRRGLDGVATRLNTESRRASGP